MKFSSVGRCIAAGISAIAMLASVAACGGSNSSSGNSTTSKSAGITMTDVNNALTSDKDITLNYWTWRTDIEQPLIDSFQKGIPAYQGERHLDGCGS